MSSNTDKKPRKRVKPKAVAKTYEKPSLKQYTIRGIPAGLDRELKKRAQETGKSFNQVALEALFTGAGESVRPRRDFGEVIGSLSSNEADRMDEEIRLQRQIDPELWK